MKYRTVSLIDTKSFEMCWGTQVRCPGDKKWAWLVSGKDFMKFDTRSAAQAQGKAAVAKWKSLQ